MNCKWIEDSQIIIFEQGKDLGEGVLRIVGNLDKMFTVESKHAVSFKEADDVIFGKGTSTFLEKYTREFKKEETTYIEEQFKIVGLTSAGRPVLIIITPRDNGFAKRVITGWQVSHDSSELKKLLEDCPGLATRYQEWKKLND